MYDEKIIKFIVNIKPKTNSCLAMFILYFFAIIISAKNVAGIAISAVVFVPAASANDNAEKNSIFLLLYLQDLKNK